LVFNTLLSGKRWRPKEIPKERPEKISFQFINGVTLWASSIFNIIVMEKIEEKKKELNIDPIEEYVSFLNISAKLLLKYAEKDSQYDLTAVVKRLVAEYFQSHYVYNQIQGRIELFCGSFIFDVDKFNSLLSIQDWVFDSIKGKNCEDPLKKIDRLYEEKKNWKDFDYEKYPFVIIPNHNDNVTLLFIQEDIYQHLLNKIDNEKLKNTNTANMRLDFVKEKVLQIEDKHTYSDIDKWKANILFDITTLPNTNEANSSNKGKFTAREVFLALQTILKQIDKNIKDSAIKNFASHISGYSIETLNKQKKNLDSSTKIANNSYIASLEKIKKDFQEFIPKNSDPNNKSHINLHSLVDSINKQIQRQKNSKK
jgi:hypothetical protein